MGHVEIVQKPLSMIWSRSIYPAIIADIILPKAFTFMNIRGNLNKRTLKTSNKQMGTDCEQ